MGSQVPIAIQRPPSEYAEVRVLRVARRVIRQFCRENVLLHKGQVITSEARLAKIFGQRVVDKVRATIAVDTQKTSKRRREAAAPRHRQYSTSLARSYEHFADGSASAVLKKKGSLEASGPHWVRHVQRQLFDSPGTITTDAEVPQLQLVARSGSPGNAHPRRQD